MTCTSASLIGHIWTNNLANYLSSGIIHTSISDHFPVISSFGQRMTNPHCFTSFEKRIFSEDSLSDFEIALSSYDWRADANDRNTEECFDSYVNTFMPLYNSHFPIKTYKVKEKHVSKPYITQGLKNSIKQRNKLQKLCAKWLVTYEYQFKTY